MTDPLIQVPDADRAESAPKREQPRPGEPKPPVAADEQRPQPMPTPEALRQYKGGDAG